MNSRGGVALVLTCASGLFGQNTRVEEANVVNLAHTAFVPSHTHQTFQEEHALRVKMASVGLATM